MNNKAMNVLKYFLGTFAVVLFFRLAFSGSLSVKSLLVYTIIIGIASFAIEWLVNKFKNRNVNKA